MDRWCSRCYVGYTAGVQVDELGVVVSLMRVQGLQQV